MKPKRWASVAPPTPDQVATAPARAMLDPGIAQWAFDHAEPAGIATDTLPGSGLFYLPVVAPMRTRGMLVIEPENRRWILIPEQRQQLDTFATLAAIALERVHYVEVAQDALVHMESERLRNSRLAALSHDWDWYNLIENATKYTLAGSRIVIAAEVSGESLEVTVYDNGPGAATTTMTTACSGCGDPSIHPLRGNAVKLSAETRVHGSEFWHAASPGFHAGGVTPSTMSKRAVSSP